MLFRVSGKLSDGRPFASRIEADSAIAAVVAVRSGLAEAKIPDTDIRELVSRPMQGKSSVHIGKAKAPATAPTKPAKK